MKTDHKCAKNLEICILKLYSFFMSKTDAEKFNFLMELTNTSNVMLSRALSFDASYISRIRSGKRNLPSKHPFTENVSAYFARNIKDNYKAAAASEICPGQNWPDNTKEAETLIYEYLYAKDDIKSLIGHMAASISRNEKKEHAGSFASPEKIFYYGNQGKREAVYRFLKILIDNEEPADLLLYSDEPMDWLYEDNAFAADWSRMLIQLLKKGSKIHIVHSISRDANEMWEAVRKWMPLYFSGGVESWYYPKIRDDVYHRTLFVASPYVAVISSTVHGQTGDTLNLLLQDEDAVKALENEYNSYHSLCRPLLDMVRPARLKDLKPIINAFLKAEGDALVLPETEAAVCVKESAGVLIIRTEAPLAAISMKEPRIVAAIQNWASSEQNVLRDGAAEDYLTSLF